MKKNDTLEILKQVITFLEKESIAYEIPYVHINKQEFNHLNIVVVNTIDTRLLSTNLNISNIKEKNNIIFTEIDNFSVNFIKCDSENLKSAFYYYNWNILNVLMQSLFNQFKMRYTPNGLYFNNIFLTKNMKEIFEFLGLKFSIFNKGFINEFQIYDYIQTSIFLNQKAFHKEIFRSFDPFYQFNKEYYSNFLKHFNDITKYEPDFKSDDSLVDFIDGFFPKSKVLEIYYKKEVEKEIKKKS